MPPAPRLRIPIALLLALGLAVMPFATAASSSTTTVRPFASALAYARMVLDSAGVPHLAWVSSGVIMAATLDRSTGTLVHVQAIGGLLPRFGSSGFFFLVSSGPRLYLVWSENRPGSFGDMVAAYSDDGGVHFGTPFPAPATNVMGVQAAGDASGSLYLTWTPGVSVNGRLTSATDFAVLRPETGSWESRARLDQGNGTMAMAVDGDRVHVAWLVTYQVDTYRYNASVYVRSSSDRGETFGPAVAVAPGDSGSKYQFRAVAGGGYLYLIWRHYVEEDLAYSVSSDGGATFTPAAPWPSDLSGFFYGPDGSFYGILDVPTAYARVPPGSVTGTRIETGAPAVPTTPNSQITDSILSVDAEGRYYLLYSSTQVLVMTGSSYEAEYRTALVTDLPMSGTPIPVLETGLALAVGLGFSAALGYAARVRRRQTPQRSRGAVVRSLGRILGLLPPDAPEPQGRPIASLVAAIAAVIASLGLGLFYLVGLQGFNAYFGLAAPWMAVEWVAALAAMAIALIGLAAAPPRHMTWGAFLAVGSSAALLAVPVDLAWGSVVGFFGSALAILWLPSRTM